jgi:hypothetical protein
MKYVLSFFGGLVLLGAVAVAVHFGAVILNEWTYGIKNVVLVIFIIVLMSGVWKAAELLTFNKLKGGFTFVIWLVLMMGLGGIETYRYSQIKVAGLEAAADGLGLHYSPGVPVDSTLGRSVIFQNGLFDMASMALVGEYKGVGTKIFTYSYETGGGDGPPDPYYRTVVVFHDSLRKLPEFHMKPEGLGDVLFGWLDDKEDLDFPEDPEFSRRYYLVGPETESVRAFFGPAQRRFFVESEHEWSIAGVNHRVAIYLDDDRLDLEVKPNFEAVRDYLEEIWAVYRPLRAAMAPPEP